MATDARTIQATWWQPKAAALGDVVTDLDDINQCILTILTTPPGSDPHRPDFAMDLLSYLDRPLNEARPAIVRDAIRAIRLWEQRATVLSVGVAAGDVGQIVVTVTWTPSGNENSEPVITTLTLSAVAA